MCNGWTWRFHDKYFLIDVTSTNCFIISTEYLNYANQRTDGMTSLCLPTVQIMSKPDTVPPARNARDLKIYMFIQNFTATRIAFLECYYLASNVGSFNKRIYSKSCGQPYEKKDEKRYPVERRIMKKTKKN